jgi:hypothetical protein
MKPYFAKYLPVEGEIKDMMIHPKNHPEPMSVKGLPAPPIAYSKNGWIPVKLFLCSRDIQVGDKIFCPDGNNPTKEWNVIASVGDATASNQVSIHLVPRGAYKVIGEISPDATWVKEGDKFEEDEIKVLGMLKQPMGSHVDWVQFTPTAERKGYTKAVQIKCHNCGHFH